ncbi:hypothetical protein BT96DRAFT_940447 [Gymnopus androsaceus JB14]|uniref:Uncharacterized protein n=1 Tax=Gymnopus androsaceus JB14 TaxID=1447944 RepID=A0A6A4HMI3_9AGAR|nr:hypothetical protein BT96DRAFT_940447 [Gymnopus androsaceus JB14]
MKFTVTTLAISLLAVSLSAVAHDIGDRCSYRESADVSCVFNSQYNHGYDFIVICNGEEYELFVECDARQRCEQESRKDAMYESTTARLKEERESKASSTHD